MRGEMTRCQSLSTDTEGVGSTPHDHACGAMGRGGSGPATIFRRFLPPGGATPYVFAAEHNASYRISPSSLLRLRV